MALATLAFHQAATDLLDCVCEQLDALHTEVTGLAGCPCRKMVIAGAAAADGCDGGCSTPGPGEWPGQLTVAVQRVFTTDRASFPRELAVARDARNCAQPVQTAVTLAVTLFRCHPLPTDKGCPPTPAELSASALQTNADMIAVQRAALCCFASTSTRPNGRRYVLGATAPIGPQGGCIGFQTLVTVLLDN
jgi:hypothetical protein